MYVKVTAGEHPFGQRGDFLTEVQPPVYYDYAATKLGPNAEWDEDGRLIHPGDIDWDEVLNASISFLHMLEFSVERTQYEQNEGLVPFRYVYWFSDRGIEAVITTRNIFIMGANGKTIDKVG